MKKIFLPYNISQYDVGSQITVTGDDYNHIAHSLRASVGECFILGDMSGNERQCRIDRITKQDVTFCVTSHYTRQNVSASELVICFALLKGDKNEEIIKRCTEIGASRFIPVVTHNCVMRVDDKSAKSKLLRWQQIAKEASMQSGRQFVPEIAPIMKISQLCNMDLPQHRYFGQILSDMSAGDILRECAGQAAAVCIGPEGDFTQDEEEMLRQSGWIGVCCPTNVMRSETAAFYFTSVVSFMQASDK